MPLEIELEALHFVRHFGELGFENPLPRKFRGLWRSIGMESRKSDEKCHGVSLFIPRLRTLAEGETEVSNEETGAFLKYYFIGNESLPFRVGDRQLDRKVIFRHPRNRRYHKNWFH
jgi:hypothetical protein